jgi:hypothetical protein
MEHPATFLETGTPDLGDPGTGRTDRSRTTPCLDDTQLLQLWQGRLLPEAVQRFEAHIDQCPDCLQLLDDLAQAQPDDARAGPPELLPRSADGADEAAELIDRRYVLSGKLGQGNPAAAGSGLGHHAGRGRATRAAGHAAAVTAPRRRDAVDPGTDHSGE